MSQEDTYQALAQIGPCTAKQLGSKMKVGPSGIGSCLRRLRDHGEAKMVIKPNPNGRGGRSVVWEAI